MDKVIFFSVRYHFLKDFIYLFLGRGKEGAREGEKHQCVVVSWVPTTEDLAHNPGMCPDWESNQWPFGLQSGTQSTEPHQPGCHLKKILDYHRFNRKYINMAIYVLVLILIDDWWTCSNWDVMISFNSRKSSPLYL